MESGKREPTERIQLQNQESIRTLEEKENYMYKGILEADTIKQKDRKKKKYLRRMKKLLETKPQKSDGRDKYQVNSSWKVLRVIL